MHRQHSLHLTCASLAVCALFFVTAASADRISAPGNAEVYFIAPQDGDTVESPVTVKMGLRGMGIAPAGIDMENTGHHHMLINTTTDDINLDQPLPFEDHKVHFGGGQTEGQVELEPGTHTLQLLLMDYRHMSFDPPVASDVITITVE